jgi:hypothetical protein
MIRVDDLKAVTASLDDAKLLQTIFASIAQELPAHEGFARVHADQLAFQIERREAAIARATLPTIEQPTVLLLVGADLWTEVEVRLINAGEIGRLASRPTKSDN